MYKYIPVIIHMIHMHVYIYIHIQILHINVHCTEHPNVPKHSKHELQQDCIQTAQTAQEKL